MGRSFGHENRPTKLWHDVWVSKAAGTSKNAKWRVVIESLMRMPPGHAFEYNGVRLCGVAVRRCVVVSVFMRLWLDGFWKEILKQIDQKRHRNQSNMVPQTINNCAFWPRGEAGGTRKSTTMWTTRKNENAKNQNIYLFQMLGDLLNIGGFNGSTFTVVLWKRLIKMLGNK